jgi:hypothetical protein
MTAADVAHAIVRGRNMTRSQLTGTLDGGDWAHRVAAGRGGPKTPANGLWLTRREHDASHHEPTLSRRAGWMVDTRIDPIAVPALCLVQGIPGWWVLADLARLATDEELATAAITAEIDPALTLPTALTELRALTGLAA